MTRREVNLIGGFYKDESLPFSSQDAINWLPEPDESGMGRSPWRMLGVPGLLPLGVTASDLLIQGLPGVATIGDAYSFSFVASGGVAPYQFSYVGLPPGLTGSGATVSGTPTASGRFTVTANVTDAQDVSVSVVVSFFVANAAGTVPDGGGAPSGGTGAASKPALLPNADFELGDVSWDAVARTPSVSPGFTIENSPGYDGSDWVCRWTGTTEDANDGPDYFENSKAVWLVGSCSSTVFVRCTAIDPGARALAGISVRVYADSAKTTLVQTIDGGQAVFTATGGWRSVTVQGVTGAYVSVLLSAECVDGDATLEFDSVEFDGSEFITGYSDAPLTNGDFEAGATGWNVLNDGPNDSFAIVNDGGTWLLRWTATGVTTTESRIVNAASFLNATGAVVTGRVSVRCASITSGPGLEAYAAVSIRAYNDPELTDLFAEGSQVSIRPQGTSGFNVITGTASRAKYLQFVINCATNTPCVLEFDLASWNGREALPA